MKTIALLVPPYKKVGIEVFSRSRLLPLGLLSLAATVRRAGFTVEVFDCLASKKRMKNFKSGLLRHEFAIVGITANTFNAHIAKEIARFVKKVDGRIVTVAGGPHFSFEYQEALDSSFDFVVRFEGESVFLNLVRAIYGRKDYGHLEGIAYKKMDGSVVARAPDHPADLDTLPPIDFHSTGVPFHLYRWWFRKPRNVHYLTGRGCNFACRFCTLPRYWGTYRAHSTERVVRDIKYFRDQCGIRCVWLVDDDLMASRQHFKELCERFISENLGIRWFFQARVDTIIEHQDLLGMAREAGAFFVLVGAESIHTDNMRFTGKGFTREDILQAARTLKGANFLVWLSFMVGFPEDGPEVLADLLDFAMHCNTEIVTFSPYTPYPGTAFWDELKKQKREDNGNTYEQYTMVNPVLNTKYLSKEALKKKIYQMYRAYYLRPGYVQHLFSGERLKRKILWCLALRGIVFLLFPSFLFSSQYIHSLGTEEPDPHT